MARLIDAENLLNQYEQIDWYSISKEGQFMRGATTEDNPFIHYYDGEEIIKNAPTVDAVEVVRCRECKFGSWDSEPDDAMVCVRTNDGFWRSGSDFCSRGERKEGADND